MAKLGPARGPKRAGPGPENPGPRTLRAETGLMIFYLRFLCALCAGRWVITRKLCIVVTYNLPPNSLSGLNSKIFTYSYLLL